MSKVTKEINRITGTIIGISGKLILYALVILLLVEGMSKGYAFGHEVFHSTAMEAEPGRDIVVTIGEDKEPNEIIGLLHDMGLIGNELAVRVQLKFYEYKIYPGTYTLNTSMTPKEILQVLNEKPEEES
ncbi:MAG: aminodeoxychorismate lyase [Brotaphodocola sp.]